MLFNVSNASVFKKEGGVEKEVKSENCEHQLSVILKAGKNEIWRMEITPPILFPFLLFIFFTSIARLSKRAPFLLFSPELASNSPGVFFFALIFFLEKTKEGNWRKRRIDFHSFFFFLGGRENGEEIGGSFFRIVFFF